MAIFTHVAVGTNDMAKARGQSLAQMALAWVLRFNTVTSVLIGASGVAQIDDAIGMLKNISLNAEELQTIETILKG